MTIQLSHVTAGECLHTAVLAGNNSVALWLAHGQCIDLAAAHGFHTLALQKKKLINFKNEKKNK